MKKLLKYISPLAPDDSGACSVLYEMGGITVICDAGGCAGNVCGFDEPRWFEKRSALFSAGLRDMDAILGRDDRLVEKLTKVTQQVDARFTAIVGTPVPAVIATDYKALQRMSERRTGLPCLTIASDGTGLYDKGEEEAYYKLFERFAQEKRAVIKGKVGIIGATPLNTGLTTAKKLMEHYDNAVCFGLDSSLDEVINASSCERIAVIAPSGLRAAKYLKERFGTPFTTEYPLIPEAVKAKAGECAGKRVLIIHQQMAANALRELIDSQNVTVGSLFMLDKGSAQAQDVHIKDEEALRELVLTEGYDVIFADISLKRALKEYSGEFIDLSHYAVSGRLSLS